MQRLTLPRDICNGYVSMEILNNLTGKRASSVPAEVPAVGTASLDKAEADLKKAVGKLKSMKASNPIISSKLSLNTSRSCRNLVLNESSPLAAVPPIDAEKTMWLNYEYPAITFDKMRKFFGLPRLRRKAHFITISSTSGTDMEINSFSIITDDKSGIK